MIDGYITVQELAKKWDINERTVQSMCGDGRIPGAVKFGRSWAIPENTVKPIDHRVVSGKYKKHKK